MRSPSAPPPAPSSPTEILKDRGYLAVLIIGAALGIPVAVVAYFFLKVVAEAQQYFFTNLPTDLGFHGEPIWWPVPLLVLSGLLVALTIRYLPGTAGHEPAEGFKPAGAVRPIDLPGIVIASVTTLSLGVVLGPEAPLIAIGSGLGVLAMYLLKKDAPKQAVMIIAAAASFAAISTLIGGSPLAGAFLLMEAAGIGGSMLGVVLVPGLLAAGLGALIFLGLDTLTGFGRFSLSIPGIPTFTTPTVAEFLWAIGIGLAAAVLGGAIKRLARALQPAVAKRRLMLTPVLGFAVGALAIVFAEGSGKSSSEVLFSGQSALPSLLQNAGGWAVGALVLLIVCKGLAYAVSLSAFRGGPTFPGMFIGAVGGIALSHLPGLPMIAGAAMGIGAMTAVMLELPLTAVLFTAIFLSADAVALTPLVIVAVVVGYVANAHLGPLSTPSPTENAPEQRDDRGLEPATT
jgi:H+/Cl- antiporter ClcA